MNQHGFCQSKSRLTLWATHCYLLFYSPLISLALVLNTNRPTNGIRCFSWGISRLWFEFRASFKDFPTLRQPIKGPVPPMQCNFTCILKFPTIFKLKIFAQKQIVYTAYFICLTNLSTFINVFSRNTGIFYNQFILYSIKG